MTQCSKKEMCFSVFLLYQLAQAWKKPVPKTYEILTQTGILDEYILKCYDTLHTLGKEYLVEDITEFVKEKGVAV